ncbi:MAG: hypothetical protein U0Q12_27115 [Vicinamibacterales bacterium]
MMTIITRVKLKQGAEPEWDAAMRERLENAEQREGWISGHLLMPLEGLDERHRGRLAHARRLGGVACGRGLRGNPRAT